MALKDDKTFKFIISISTTVLLAFAGYYYTWDRTRSDTQYKAQLDRVNEQLREFYGPLYALVEAEDNSFQHFLKVTRPEVEALYWDPKKPPNESQKVAWRRWINEVTIPNYLKMEKIILEHSDLLIEDDIPKPILDLTSHIAGYKPVVAAWKDKDYSRNLSFFFSRKRRANI